MTLSLVCIVALASATAAEEGWPQFRGPSGDGISHSTNPPLEWSETENIVWKAAVPGCGRSSPVLLGDRIWLTTAVARGMQQKRVGPDEMQVADHVSLRALSLDRADGKCLWEATLFEVDKPPPAHVLNSFATPTPVVEPGRLYCDFGAMGTACVDAASGKVLWTQRLAIDHMVGPGSSPILYKNLLILVRDGCDEQYVVALDKNTGQVAWKTGRPPINARPDLKKAFSTPLVVEAAGGTQMLTIGAHWVVSYEPATGKEIWRVRHGIGWSLASRPVCGNGMVYVCTGSYAPHLWAIRTDGRGDVTTTHAAWKVTDQPIPIMSSPILVGKELYSASDQGLVLCFDALTGQSQWRCRLRHALMASPVFAAGRLYFCTRDGTTTVLKAGRQLEQLAENKLDGVVTASPAIVDDTIFLRTDTHLYRIGKR